jgi:predicted nucleotidyltransferase
VAREAALLLYTSQEKEYMQAKQKAAHALGTRLLPRNVEVAKELDQIGDEVEGQAKLNTLIQMRQEALAIMQALKKFKPKLVGSVWRGTSNQRSDIDIVAFSSKPEKVLLEIQKHGFIPTKMERQPVTKQGGEIKTFHIYLVLSSMHEVEVVVRDLDRIGERQRCEIYGDIVKGLSYPQLAKILKETPYQKFVPEN